MQTIELTQRIQTRQEMWLELEGRLDEIQTLVPDELRKGRADRLREGVLNIYSSSYPYFESEKVGIAIDFAVKNHNSVRESGYPYVVHPLQVGHILAATGTDTITIDGGILHDLIEDNCEKRIEMMNEIYRLFGRDVLTLVNALTADPMEDKALKKSLLVEKIIKSSAGDNKKRQYAIKVADRVANLLSLNYLSSKDSISSADRTAITIKDTEENILPLARKVDRIYQPELRLYSYTKELLRRAKSGDAGTFKS
jgi:(p)ppGpp synthase/HD superfamily hydrolase